MARDIGAIQAGGLDVGAVQWSPDVAPSLLSRPCLAGPWLDTTRPIFTPDPVNRNHSLNRGRTAWWLTLPGIDGGQQWFDLLGRYPGTLMNMGSGSGWKGTTRPGGAGHLQFDGVDDYVNLGAAGDLPSGDFTIAFWINPTTLADGAILLAKGAFQVRGFYLQYLTSNGWNFVTNQSGTFQITRGTGPSSNAWTRLVIAKTGTSVRIYSNARDVTTTTGTHSSPATSPDALILGAFVGGTATFFPGLIDDVSTWSRGLPASEIRADYDLSRQGYPGVLNRSRVSIPAVGPAPLLRTGLRINTTRPIFTPDPVNRNHPLNLGRVGWWLALPGLDGGKTLYDLMGRYHGTLTSMGNSSNGWRASTRPGSFGASLQTDGSAGYVNCGSPTGLSGATNASFAGWVYKPSNAVSAGIGGSSGSFSSPDNHLNFIWYTDGLGYFTASAFTGGSAYGSVPIALGWRRILASYDGAGTGNSGRLKVYVDGVPQTLTFAGTIPSALGTVVPFAIGHDAPDRPCAGQYDDVSIWLRTLSAAEARADYDLSRQGYPGALNRQGGGVSMLQGSYVPPVVLASQANFRTLMGVGS